MKKIILSAFVALTALTGIAATANADYFGTSRETQQGQVLPHPFSDMERSGI